MRESLNLHITTGKLKADDLPQRLRMNAKQQKKRGRGDTSKADLRGPAKCNYDFLYICIPKKLQGLNHKEWPKITMKTVHINLPGKSFSRILHSSCIFFAQVFDGCQKKIKKKTSEKTKSPYDVTLNQGCQNELDWIDDYPLVVFTQSVCSQTSSHVLNKQHCVPLKQRK